MLDFLLGAVIVALAIRGWWRGLLREVIALGIVVFGLVIAFRLSTPVGDAIESLAGVSPEVGRFIAGLLIFLMVSVGGAIAAAILHKGMKVVPGLPTANRLAGSALAVVVVVALATVALSLLTVASPPQAIADEVEGSAIAGYLTDPGQPPQKVLGVVSGDRSLERLLNLADNIGTRRVVDEGTTVLLAPASPDDLEFDEEATGRLLDTVNRARDRSGGDPLAESDALTSLARAHAIDVYTSGRFGRDGSDGTPFEDRVQRLEIPIGDSDQVMALALTAKAAQEALLDDDQSSSLLDPDFRRIGVAALKGPLGVLVVEVVAR